MRYAFELAWVNVYIHSDYKFYPEIFHIDDILFLHPVEVGSVLIIDSTITYVCKNMV